MRKPLRRVLWGVVAVCVTGTVPAAAQDAPAIDAARDTEPASMTCGAGSDFPIGGGDFFLCINRHGNLARFTSPSGFEHINVAPVVAEGYVVCSASGTHGYDVGSIESGFGDPVVLASGASSVTIRRVTLDGQLQLDQKWTRDTGERDITVQMTLTNLAGVKTNVKLLRYVDFDADGDPGDDRYDLSQRAGWVRDARSLTMTALTYNIPSIVTMQSPVNPVSITDCVPGSVPVPGTGDVDVNLVYYIGNMAVGAKKVMKVGYRVQ